MLSRFQENLSRIVGDPGGFRYLLAVSGGADSCVLAHLFHNAGLDFALAHCNFHLRGEDSDSDMRLVQNMASRWGVRVLMREFDTLALQKGSGKSVEMVARELRYAWFEEVMGDYDFLVTAHQADDAAETLLLNICRGAALRGLASIPEKNGRVVRPLLNFSAREIRDYARQNHIPFAIDRTNSDESILRNRIRSSVIPILKEINPNVLETIARNREILRRQAGFYQNAMDRLKKSLLSERDGCFFINLAGIDRQECPELVLYEILSDFGFDAGTVRELCKTVRRSGTRHFSPTHELLVNRGELVVRPCAPDEPVHINIRSLEELEEHFTVERHQNHGHITFEKDNRTLYLDEMDLHFPIVLRTWEPGDHFFPLGGGGKQKISDFFTDHKFDMFTKNHTLLLEMNHDIVWIVGHRSDNRYRIDLNKTKNYYKIRYDE